MDNIRIDVSRDISRDRGMPRDDYYGSWTFVIDGHPVTLFGNYAEAKSMAKLYARMSDVSAEPIKLTRFNASGHVRVAS